MKDLHQPQTKLNIEMTEELDIQSPGDVLAQIEQAKQEWETTVDSLPQLVCLLDQQKRVIRANRTVERWELAQVIEVKGKDIHNLLHAGCVDPACYLVKFLDQAWEILSQGESWEHEAEDSFLKRYLHLQIRPILAPDKLKNKLGPNVATVVIHDITVSKQLEQALQKANEELEQRVEERTAQLKRVATENARLYETQREQYRLLQQSQDELIQIEKMAALGRLVASIAHEINNPLQSVQGFLNLMEEELDGHRRQEKLHYYLDIADTEIDRISTIVRRMRDFYRSTSHDSQPTRPESLDSFYHSTQTDLQLVDLHATLESVLLLTNKKLQQSNIKVVRAWADTLPEIQVNSDHLKQVFLNLTLNAIDAMVEQGGTLSIHTMTGQIQSDGNKLQEMVQVKFSDTGVGVSSKALPHLFDPLFTTKEKGSGFGLFTSHEIIKAHHGQITAASQLGEGTTFTILLPVAQS